LDHSLKSANLQLPDSHYPATIWTFLNESAPSSPAVTRKERLVQTWIQVRRIDSLASADKIDRLTSEPSELLKLTIDDLEDRAAMLQDVRARIFVLEARPGGVRRITTVCTDVNRVRPAGESNCIPYARRIGL
jgi:hypothetical protein